MLEGLGFWEQHKKNSQGLRNAGQVGKKVIETENLNDWNIYITFKK